MRILIGCEESQAVTIAFRKLGHEAFSCDLEPCSGGHPEWHLQEDVFSVLDGSWDAGIFFPPCTYLTVSANRWLKDGITAKSGILTGAARRKAQDEAVKFVKRLSTSVPISAIENPIGVLSTKWRKPDQIIQPWQFGHGETKATCLWLNNLPKLKPTNIVEGREDRIFRLPPTADRAKLRSKTYQGIADAMADQWSKAIEEYYDI